MGKMRVVESLAQQSIPGPNNKNNMLSKTKHRVSFSSELEFIPTAIISCLDSSNSSDRTIEIEDVTNDEIPVLLHDDTDDSSIQAQASPISIQCYRVGDTLRSSNDMEQLTNLEDVIQSIYTLQSSEFAWVKRKSGIWTFGQLLEWSKNDRGEDVMIFSVSENGTGRKNLRPMRWIKMVRRCSSHVKCVR